MGQAARSHAEPDFRALFESAPAPYLVLTPELKIVAVSDAYLRATMTKREEILGRGLFEVFPDNPDDPNASGVRNLKASLDRVRQGGVPDAMAVQKYDIRRPESEGGGFEERFWSPVNSPVFGKSHEMQYIIHRVEDVTDFVRLKQRGSEQEKVTEELRSRAEKMEVEVYLRAQEVAAANRQLQKANAELAAEVAERRRAEADAEAANRAKSEFLSRMSHELRTPLNAVLGFAQVLELEPLTPAQGDSVGHVLRAGRHLLGLIDEVLDISRIESGHLALSLEPVQLPELLRGPLDLIRPLAAKRNIHLHSDAESVGDLYVRADRNRLHQVLLNLLSNAVKYNRHGGRVSVSYEEAAGPRARITVTDTGPGIAPDKMNRLFSPFDRLDAEQLGIEGTGLGLALSKRLIELMQGTIGADSVVDQGSTFWVELPRAESPSERWTRPVEGPPPAAAVSSRPVTVLYIEDNLSNLRLIERILALRPEVTLLSAMQGGLGLDLAREHRPDVILLDLNLPDMPGGEVLHRLLADPRTQKIPVVVISADATAGQIRRLQAAGARTYMTKPLDVKAFLTLLDEILIE